MRAWLAVLTFRCCVPVFAVAPDVGPDSAFPAVGLVGGASGTAISPRSVITAKHVGASTFTVFGTTYTAANRIHHPTLDLAILNFNTDLPVWCPLGTSVSIGSTIFIVGFGDSGFLNSAGTGYDMFWWTAGVRRAVPNTLDTQQTFAGFGPVLLTYLKVYGDAAAGAGDSGGAFFSGNRLIGVTSFAINTTGGVLPNYGFAALNGGVPYHLSGAVDLTDPSVRAWIQANAILPACTGDITGDGVVDVSDFNILASHFAQTVAPSSLGDLNGDGFVDVSDFSILAANFGQSCP